MAVRRFIGFLLTLLPLFVACSLHENATEAEEGFVAVPLSLSLESGGTPAVKSTDAIIQVSTTSETPAFRGVSSIVLLPFGTKGTITATDERLGYADRLEDISTLPDNHAQLYQRKLIPRGTASFLFYGRAGTAASLANADKATNGSLVAEGLSAAQTPSDIRFLPDLIGTASDADTRKNTLITYLNGIASQSGGGVTFADGYPEIFRLFVNEGRLMSGSSNNIQVLVQKVYDMVRAKAASDLRTNLLNRIGKSPVTISSNKVVFPDSYKGYPGDGLPEGCVALRWNAQSKKFEMNPTGVYLTGSERICYPPDLWYYDNTRIRTTEKKTNTYQVLKDLYDDTSNSWATLLQEYELYDVIRPETTGAALVEPVQYGVGLLSVVLTQITGKTALRDRSQNGTIPINDNNKPLTLTGIIVGGRQPLTYDFTPQAGSQEYFSYDASFSRSARITSKSGYAGPIFALVTESEENATIPFALEFVNNSGKIIEGATGSILNGHTFYLVGMLDLTSIPVANRQRNGETVEKVFERDYKTSVSVVVEDLKNAYNVIPDLRQPRLQVGLSVTFDWVLSTPTEIPLQ